MVGLNRFFSTLSSFPFIMDEKDKSENVQNILKSIVDGFEGDYGDVNNMDKFPFKNIEKAEGLNIFNFNGEPNFLLNLSVQSQIIEKVICDLSNESFDVPSILKMIEDTSESQSVFSIMYLVSIIAREKPESVSQFFSDTSGNFFIKQFNYIVWIFSKCVIDSKKSRKDVYSMVIDVLFNFLIKNEFYGVEHQYYHVVIVNLIHFAFARQENEVSAEHYSNLLFLYNKIEVFHMLSDLIKSLRIVNDNKNLLAKALLQNFPNPVEEIGPDGLTGMHIFKENYTDSSFVDGWISYHKNGGRNSSMRYLLALEKTFEVEVPLLLKKFPLADLKKGNGILKLSALHIELNNASFRFCFVVLLCSVLCYIYFRCFVK